jgi:hypothetical protein
MPLNRHLPFVPVKGRLRTEVKADVKAGGRSRPEPGATDNGSVRSVGRGMKFAGE